VRRGTLIVLAGPSGVGKGSVVERLLSRDPEGLAYSVSVTSRRPRPGETDGVDYHFVSDDEFDRMIDDGELLEWAEIVGHRSGTPAGFVRDARAAGRDVVLELDVKGAQQVRAHEPEAVLIFLLPPSFGELEERLRGRATEDEASIDRPLGAPTGGRVRRPGGQRRSRPGRRGGRCYHRGVPDPMTCSNRDRSPLR
jgi:guanylate kinase